jgi:magnesium chelatase family protein
MVAKVKTFTFLGINTVDISVEVKLSHGVVAFNIVGLPDKAVNEAR